MVRGFILGAPLAFLALLAAGCGGPTSQSVASVATTTVTRPRSSSARQSGVLYASCMRAHGVSNFPDSAVSVIDGEVEMRVPLAIKNESEFPSASRACQRDLPGGGASAKPSQSTRQQLQFARCMRSHGIVNYPDPMPGGGFRITFDTNTTRFEAAQNACAAKLRN